MDIPTASNAFIEFQSWVLSGLLPIEFGGELIMLKGSAYGQIELGFFGDYFGSWDSFNDTVNPYLSQLPTPESTNITQGSWIEILAATAVGNLNTTTQPDASDTFYAKSLMAPEDVPLTNASMVAVVTYLAEVGFNNSDV